MRTTRFIFCLMSLIAMLMGMPRELVASARDPQLIASTYHKRVKKSCHQCVKNSGHHECIKKTRHKCKKKGYDYIVVGGGMSGCVLAARLSEDKNNEVLLIERGDNIDFGLKFEFEGPDGPNFDKYTEAVLKANQFYERAQNSGSGLIQYYHPQALGGLSTMSDQIFNRGAEAFWNSVDGETYSWDNMVPFFKKIENTSSITGLDPHERGDHGPLSIMRRTPDSLDQIMISEISETLYNKPPLDDYNAGELIGISPTQLVTTRLSDIASVFPDKRQTVYKAYFGKLKFRETAPNTWKSKNRKNLTILTNTIVDELDYEQCFDKSYIVKGVIINSTKKKLNLKAQKEVILSAGALNTPRILQNSGIDTIIPGIGKNLHDHILIGYSVYEDSRPYPDGVKPSSYILCASSDGDPVPDIMYHAVPTLRPRPNPTLGFPKGDDWIPLFKEASDINKWTWQAEVFNTEPLSTDPNEIAVATTTTEDGIDILELRYKFPNDPNANHSGAMFTTNDDLVGAKGPYGIPSDIEIYYETKVSPNVSSGCFYRVIGGLLNSNSSFEPPFPTGFGGYHPKFNSTQQAPISNGSFYSEYGNVQTGPIGGFASSFQGPIYPWGIYNPYLPERAIFTGWNSMRIQLRNIIPEDPSICINQDRPLATRITGWLNDVLVYDTIEANPQLRTDVINPAYPDFPVSCTVGKFGLQVHDHPVNFVSQFRNVAYRRLTPDTPSPSEFSNYFDWRFYTYITRHPLRGTVQKTCCDSFAKPVIDGLIEDIFVPLVPDTIDQGGTLSVDVLVSSDSASSPSVPGLSGIFLVAFANSSSDIITEIQQPVFNTGDWVHIEVPLVGNNLSSFPFLAIAMVNFDVSGPVTVFVDNIVIKGPTGELLTEITFDAPDSINDWFLVSDPGFNTAEKSWASIGLPPGSFRMDYTSVPGLLTAFAAGTDAPTLNPVLKDQIIFAADFLKLEPATSRLKFFRNLFGLYTADGQLYPLSARGDILNTAINALKTNPKDINNYQNIAPYRILPFGNRLGGSCKWGDDSLSVVDTDTLLVKTFKNLRICDASVIPVPFASDMQAPVMAIAEKTSHQILHGSASCDKKNHKWSKKKSWHN